MNELVGELVSKLGIQESQAKGGAGLIFQQARERMGSDFTQVATVVPGVEDMMASAPNVGDGPQPGAAPQGADIPGTQGARPGSGIPRGESAVEGGGAGGLLGGVMHEVGGVRAGAATEIAHLAGGFSKLGLEAGMIGKFVPIIVGFVKRKGGEGVSGLLAKAAPR